MDDLMTFNELCQKLRLTRQTVTRMARLGIGPPGFKIGKSVRYSAREVEEWLEQHRVGGPRLIRKRRPKHTNISRKNRTT